MLFDDTYKTIAAPAQGLFKDKGSKFIAYAFPVTNSEEVKALVQQLRSEHSKARHFCWALRLSPDRTNFRIQDDGEPSGTAGRPILNTLLSADVTNTLIVVVRYFGGTLLGVPGLINAYKTAASESLKEANIITKTVNDVYELTFGYESMNDVMRVIKDDQPEILEQTFDTVCSIKLAVRKSSVNMLLGKIDKIENVKAKYLATI